MGKQAGPSLPAGGEGPLDQVLARLSELLTDGRESAVYLKLLEDVRRVAEARVDPDDLKMMHHAFLEMRRAFQVFARFRHVRKLSIFGSARTAPHAAEYAMARELANRVCELGFMIITGAGPGIMEAAQGGAGRDRSFGVNIRLPFEYRANDVIDRDSKLVHFKYFFTRKVMFVKEADGIVLFPGGFGTHDEGFESLTLVQTGKSHMIPLVFVDRPGGTYWRGWLEYVEKQLLAGGYISPADMSLFVVTESVDVAVETIQRFYSNYHSMRYVHPRHVIRLKNAVSDELLERLNDEFSDIVVKGRYERLKRPLRPEAAEPGALALHRIAFEFDRKNYGRLRQLVDCVNEPSAS